MKIRHVMAASLLILLLAVSTACNPFQANNNADRQITEVTHGDLLVKVNGNGKTGVATEARLNFGTGGRVDVITISKGDVIKKGQILAKLETDTLELALSQSITAVSHALPLY